MGQEKSRPVYGSVHPGEESPTGEKALSSIEEITYETDPDKRGGSKSGPRIKEHVPLLDLSFSSKRSSQSSSSSLMSEDSLHDDTFRHVLEPLYEKTVAYYRERAQKGDAFGAYYVGLAYENGFGVYPKELSEARTWYRKSSEKGFILAEHAYQRLSTRPEESTPGKDTPGKDTQEKDTQEKDTQEKDTQEKDTQEKDTQEKDTPGKDTPGKVTPGKDTPGKDTPGKETPGKVTPKKDKLGVESRANLLLRAALQGHKQAVVRLRLLCDKEELALNFLKKKQAQSESKVATETDESSKADSLGSLAFLTLFLETSNDNYDDIIDLFTQAADLGNYDASYAVGKLYLHGAGKALAQNEPQAIKYLTSAADHGQLMAQIELGKHFLGKSEGHVGNEKFEAKAYRYFKQATDNGSAEGWLNIAHQYLYGEVIENDVNLAIECLERAAVTVDYTDSNRSNSRALCVLGRIYRYGLGADSEIVRDFEKALSYFTESANRKFPNACLELGKMYARGKGVEQDVSRAKALLESLHVFSESQYQLGRLYELTKESKTAELCYKQAMKHYSRDVSKHHDYTIGLYRIAKMHDYGRGTTKDLIKAKAFYYRAATSAEKTYILWWKGYGEKAFRRLANLPQPKKTGNNAKA